MILVRIQCLILRYHGSVCLVYQRLLFTSLWNVEGGIDLLPKLSMSRDQKARAADVLDDAVHGVTNVWSDETLEGMRELMQSENFWSHVEQVSVF